VIDNEKNIAFWNNNARQSNPEKGMFAGMLTGTSEFDALYRCVSEQETFLSIFKPTQDMRILEVGSGGGRWGFWLSDMVGEYVGIDISTEMVEIARREGRRRKLTNIRFECSTLPDFTGGEEFDLVYFSGVLQCMDDAVVKQCIDKADEILRKSGRRKVIISRDTVREVERLEKVGDYPAIFRTVDEYVGFFRENGYVLDRSELSYVPRRFTTVVSSLYKFPLMNYRRAYAVRETLCKIDELLGSPKLLKKKQDRRRGSSPHKTEHKFFKYVKDVAG